MMVVSMCLVVLGGNLFGGAVVNAIAHRELIRRDWEAFLLAYGQLFAGLALLLAGFWLIPTFGDIVGGGQ